MHDIKRRKLFVNATNRNELKERKWSLKQNMDLRKRNDGNVISADKNMFDVFGSNGMN